MWRYPSFRNLILKVNQFFGPCPRAWHHSSIRRSPVGPRSHAVPTPRRLSRVSTSEMDKNFPFPARDIWLTDRLPCLSVCYDCFMKIKILIVFIQQCTQTAFHSCLSCKEGRNCVQLCQEDCARPDVSQDVRAYKLGVHGGRVATWVDYL